MEKLQEEEKRGSCGCEVNGFEGINFNATAPKGKPSKVGLAITAIIGGSAVALSVVCLPFVTPALRKFVLPYVPATTTQVSNVFKALQGRAGHFIDLGSGDGRIVLEGARRGFKAVGVELNPWLVIYSKFQALRLGLSSTASFYRKDIWKTSLQPYETVVIFGVDTMMEQLEEKCRKELKPSAEIVACRFPFPNLEADKTIGEGIDAVWLYRNILKRPQTPDESEKP